LREELGFWNWERMKKGVLVVMSYEGEVGYRREEKG